ncbi:MAG: hypothetical protein ACOYD6_04365 [Limnochordia bacterium]
MAETAPKKIWPLSFPLRLRWSWFTKRLVTFFIVWLVYLLLAQQLELGVHHYLWADPAQMVFSQLSKASPRAEILLEGWPRRGPATLTQLKEEAERVLETLGLEAHGFEIQSQARPQIGVYGLTGSPLPEQQLTILAQAMAPGSWGAGPEPQRSMTIKWSSDQPPENLLYLRRRLAKALYNPLPWWKKLLLGRGGLAAEVVTVRGPLEGSWDDVLVEIERVLTSVGGRLLTTQGGEIIASTPAGGPMRIRIEGTADGLELIVQSGRP